MPAPTAPVCKLHMLWNTQIENTCIVFRSWHISTKLTFLFSCLAIIALCVFHEYIRVLQKQVDYRVALSLKDKAKLGGSATPGSARRSPSPTRGRGSSPEEESGLLSGRRIFAAKVKGVPVPTPSRVLRASIYGASVFISFFLMLVFMTYNAYLITSVVIGAALGHYVFGGTLNPDAVLNEGGQDKGMACH
ncbi:Ctr copper transporter [Coprinellus micaceus]|uniref:Copper transport protein n=1 Tax=Coprinellus micaceus TaxID=71717 RepID=A0A4Y7T3L1_COPMI|nr:Ctr copper transporter [Coprinellus micaceus]